MTWYEQIADQALLIAVLYADETGWLVNGTTHFRTHKLRGHDPLATLEQAPRTYTATGKLPPLPGGAAANG